MRECNVDTDRNPDCHETASFSDADKSERRRGGHVEWREAARVVFPLSRASERRWQEEAMLLERRYPGFQKA
jgi:hypothetical protein